MNREDGIISTPKPLSFALILGYGALSLAAQVIILREFLTMAQGVEVYLGLGLWAWLLWTGFGSLVGGRLAANHRISKVSLIQLLICLAVSLPVTVILTRALPSLLGWSTGVAPSPLSLGLWYITLSGPFCFTSGLFFPLACSWLGHGQVPSGLVGRAYGLDALGMCLGGILLQVLLLGLIDSLWLALGFGLLMSALMIWLVLSRSPRPGLLFLILFLGASVIMAGCYWLPEASRRWQWPQRTVLAVKETPYSVWTATREAEQISVAANGMWYFTYPDPQTAEEQVHYALLQHPRPERVLLLGRGIAGLVTEILKTPTLTQIEYVELDPQLIALAKRILPPEAWQSFRDPRLRVIYEDGRRFIRQSDNSYDVIIMALPEPRNALFNRYYTREFFAEVKARLNPDGVFSFGLAGSETSLGQVRTRYLALAATTLRQVFPEVVVLPGLTWGFFASPGPGSLSSDPEVLLSRRQARGVELLYVREYYLKANLSIARQAYGRQILAQAGPGSNTDLQPQGLFYGLLLTGMEENALLSRGLLWLKAAGVEKLYAALALLALALWAWSIKIRARGSQIPYFYSVFTMGLTVMGLEMVVLILFQLTLGFLYGQLGLLLAAFMAGMAGGSYLAGDRLARGAPAQAMALWSQGGLGLLMLILGVGLPWLLRQPYLREEGWSQLIFTAILISGGLLSGAVFAAQSELCRQHGATLSQSAGRLYAVDLLGATLGTLGMSFLVIPCFGPAQALFLGAAWNASAVLLLLAVKPPPVGMMT
jgi:spermidine synthase